MLQEKGEREEAKREAKLKEEEMCLEIFTVVLAVAEESLIKLDEIQVRSFPSAWTYHYFKGQ